MTNYQRATMLFKANKERADRLAKLELEVRSDLYYTLEGVTGDKILAKMILAEFRAKFKELGDTIELYDYFMGKLEAYGTLTKENGVTSFEWSA